MILIQRDANATLGPEIIPHDPHSITSNGKLLRDLLFRQKLFCLNAHQLCEGLITRHRKTKLGDEKAILDYVIMCKGLAGYVERMVIDEKRENILTKYLSSKGVRQKSESDHNPIYARFNIKFRKAQTAMRMEIFDFKNLEAHNCSLR